MYVGNTKHTLINLPGDINRILVNSLLVATYRKSKSHWSQSGGLEIEKTLGYK